MSFPDADGRRRVLLPAHRFEDRKKKKHKGDVRVFDFDGTITGAPDFMSRIAQGLRDQGDTIVVLTGNTMARKDLLKTLDDYGFPYDEVVQYHDDDSNGVSRAEYLKKFNAVGAFDNRIDRAVLFASVCPHLYLVVEPTKDDQQAAQKADAKQSAKQTAKDIGLRFRASTADLERAMERAGVSRSSRAERRGPPRIPPGYNPHGGTAESHCGNCDMFWQGMCWGYGDVRVDEVTGKCDEWMAELPPGEATP